MLKTMLHVYRIIFSCSISLKHILSLHIPHAVGIVISRYCIFGNDVWVYANCVIGGDNTPPYKRPKIGNRVIIYSNSVISGDVVIGDNVVISANSLVLHDVPSNELWGGVPAQKIRNINGSVIEAIETRKRLGL